MHFHTIQPIMTCPPLSSQTMLPQFYATLASFCQESNADIVLPVWYAWFDHSVGQ
jgi:hypothetical protein